MGSKAHKSNNSHAGTSATSFVRNAFSSPMQSPSRNNFNQDPAAFFSKFLPSRSQKSTLPFDVRQHNHGRSSTSYRQISSFSSPIREPKTGPVSALTGRTSLGLPSSGFGSVALVSQLPLIGDPDFTYTKPHSSCQDSINANLSTTLPLHEGLRTNSHLSTPQVTNNDTYANNNTHDQIGPYPEIPARRRAAATKHLPSNASKVSKPDVDASLNPRRREAGAPILHQGPQSRAAQNYDAYSAFSDDEDIWSTLPARKKPQKKASGSLKQSGRFRLPLTMSHLSSINSDTADSGESQAVKKRKVTTYLPPPKRRRSNSEPPQDTRQHALNTSDVTVGSKLDDALDTSDRTVAKWSIKRLNGKFAYRGPNHEEAHPTASKGHQQLTDTRKSNTSRDNDGNSFQDLALSDQFSVTNSDPCLPCDEHRILDSYSQVRRAIADVSGISKFSYE